MASLVIGMLRLDPFEMGWRFLLTRPERLVKPYVLSLCILLRQLEPIPKTLRCDSSPSQGDFGCVSCDPIPTHQTVG